MARYTLDLDDNEVEAVRALLPAGTLRKKPARRQRETPDYVATVRRMLAALAKRAEGDIDDLPAIAELRTLADELLRSHIDRCRQIGVPWSEIGERLGTTRQSAQITYGRKPSKQV